ncbi:MAG: hypothetical protein ACREBO_13520 [Novosphingobium sp.]
MSASLSPVELLAHESRVRYGPVAAEVGGATVAPGRLEFGDCGFVLNCPSGLRFRYDKGAGVTVDRPPGADAAEEVLWLQGSCYAAIASLHGFFPLHASAVACEGRVYAFSGPAGAGKSSLVAELGRHGLALFCDDTLLLDLSGAEVRCLPGHKRLKLLPDALAMTGASREEKVMDDWDKFYATPPGGTVEQALPLGRLCFLETGGEVAFAPIAKGGERLARLEDDHYTADLFARAAGHPLAERFRLLGRLARDVAMSRFIRPFDPNRFARDAALAARQIRDWAAA